jgi:AGCS family alanine or glycine:cation symporter
VWITGLFTAAVVGIVILGGIGRIGKVTGVLAPVMAGLYVTGALIILAINIVDVPAAFGLIFTEAFNPTAGVAGTGTGALLVTMMWGVRRGLFSNEAGQGSAPIAHAAAKTDEPVSEGVVALLEPFIDTIVICTMTGLVLITTGVWDDTHPTALEFGGGDASYVQMNEANRYEGADAPQEIVIENGVSGQGVGDVRFAWHDAPVDGFYVDEAQTQPFTGRLLAGEGVAVGEDGTRYPVLYGNAADTAAPLTITGFSKGLDPVGLGGFGKYIVLIAILLFAISTAISWSYYGDRCANYLFGTKGVLPFKAVFVVMHFVGAVTSLNAIWALGDVALGLVTFPNLLALILLSPMLVKLTKSYFDRKPWVENEEAHKRAKAEGRI